MYQIYTYFFYQLKYILRKTSYFLLWFTFLNVTDDKHLDE